MQVDIHIPCCFSFIITSRKSKTIPYYDIVLYLCLDINLLKQNAVLTFSLYWYDIAKSRFCNKK